MWTGWFEEWFTSSPISHLLKNTNPTRWKQHKYLHIQEWRRRGADGECGTRRRAGATPCSLAEGAEYDRRPPGAVLETSPSRRPRTLMSGTRRWLIACRCRSLWWVVSSWGHDESSGGKLPWGQSSQFTSLHGFTSNPFRNGNNQFVSASQLYDLSVISQTQIYAVLWYVGICLVYALSIHLRDCLMFITPWHQIQASKWSYN